MSSPPDDKKRDAQTIQITLDQIESSTPISGEPPKPPGASPSQVPPGRVLYIKVGDQDLLLDLDRLAQFFPLRDALEEALDEVDNARIAGDKHLESKLLPKIGLVQTQIDALDTATARRLAAIEKNQAAILEKLASLQELHDKTQSDAQEKYDEILEMITCPS